VGQPKAQDLSSKLEDIITAARPHLTNEEFMELEELLQNMKTFLLGITKTMGGLTKFIIV
jgi:hypothetical protein